MMNGCGMRFFLFFEWNENWKVFEVIVDEVLIVERAEKEAREKDEKILAVKLVNYHIENAWNFESQNEIVMDEIRAKV